tara:strand:+ start:149 stop:475 length:327 start_codon:yes stop_codon:yes gene_type:complete
MAIKEEKIIDLLTFLKSAMGKYKNTIPIGIIIVLINTKSSSNLPWNSELARRKTIKNTNKRVELIDIFFKSFFVIIKGNTKTKISIKIFGNALTYSSKGMMKYNKIKT